MNPSHPSPQLLRPRGFFPRLFVSLAALAAPAAHAATLVATNATELQSALSTAAAGDTVVARAGTYSITQPLVVKDGVALRGEGTMRLGTDGLPTGFDPAGLTVLQASSTLAGDLLTLGHGTSISALALRDVAGRTGGNVLVVGSRASGDVVSTSIVECEIFNPLTPGAGLEGPSGRAIVVITRNPNPTGAPPPHEGTVLAVRLTRSLVRATESHPVFGSGFWAHNFAARSRIDLVVAQSVLGGGIELIGGNSRPEAVTGSSITLESRGNLYRSDSTGAPQAMGWMFLGATSAAVGGTTPVSPANNRIDVLSVQDRIEGFQTTIFATGARRPSAVAAPARGNTVDLSIHGVRLRSTVRDFNLLGTESLGGPIGTDTNNTVRVLLANATGSGARENIYRHGDDLGAGNRLEFVGSATGFGAGNASIQTAPSGDFFNSGAPWQLSGVSARGSVSPGNPLIAGLIVTGRAPKRFLLRATGPALAAFGVTGALADPMLSVHSGSATVAQNDNWANDTAARDAAVQIGAFPLAAGSTDAALVQTLNPGVYTLVATGAGTTTGNALLEAFELP